MGKDFNEQVRAEESILSGLVNEEAKTYTFEKMLSINGESRKGTFIAKYLSVMGRLRIGTLRAKLLEGAPAQSLDVVTDDIAYMVAFLTTALITTPKWFSYDHLDDIEDLKSLYLEVADFMSTFRERYVKNTNVGCSEKQGSKTTVENEQVLQDTTE